tara:strand:+ start:276 stop:497 length:222 start_codon:yes stop_codon:yes gene_type:complete
MFKKGDLVKIKRQGFNIFSQRTNPIGIITQIRPVPIDHEFVYNKFIIEVIWAGMNYNDPFIYYETELKMIARA